MRERSHDFFRVFRIVVEVQPSDVQIAERKAVFLVQKRLFAAQRGYGDRGRRGREILRIAAERKILPGAFCPSMRAIGR